MIVCYQYRLKFSIAYDDPTTAVSAYSISKGEHTLFMRPDMVFNGNRITHTTSTMEEIFTPICAWRIKKLNKFL